MAARGSSDLEVSVGTPNLHLPPIITRTASPRDGSPRYVLPAFRTDFYTSPRQASGRLSARSATSSRAGPSKRALDFNQACPPPGLSLARTASGSSPPRKVQHLSDTDVVEPELPAIGEPCPVREVQQLVPQSPRDNVTPQSLFRTVCNTGPAFVIGPSTRVIRSVVTADSFYPAIYDFSTRAVIFSFSARAPSFEAFKEWLVQAWEPSYIRFEDASQLGNNFYMVLLFDSQHQQAALQ
ncbi:unnamed protein product [Calypogeia fissa]